MVSAATLAERRPENQWASSAGVGIAVAVALIRGIVGRSGKGIGNFWVDIVRTILYVLLPIWQAQFAISLAMELDKTVLLVDADVSRPAVLKRLGD